MTCAQRHDILQTVLPYPPNLPSPPPPPELPAPPPVSTGRNLTEVQEDVLRRAAMRGGNLSVVAAETQRLLELLDLRATRSYLAHFDESAGLHLLSSTELLERVREELDVAEVVHNFEFSGHGGTNQGWEWKPYCGADVLTDFGEEMDWFYNIYELWLKDFIDQPDRALTDDIETDALGFPDFIAYPPTEEEASDRIVWGALNIHRKATGNPVCGAVSAVFARKPIGPNALVTPLDSGVVHQVWNDIQRFGDSNWFQSLIDEDTVANWNNPTQPSLTTSESYVHLLPTHVRALSGSRFIAGDDYVSYNLARLLVRLLSRRTYRAPFIAEPARPVQLNFMENRFGYLEFNPTMRIGFPNGVLMMVGVFNLLVGTPKADQLRSWCISRGWPLLWTFDPFPLGGTPCENDRDPISRVCFEHHDALADYEGSNVRLLDPAVLREVPHGHNLTIDLAGEAFGRAAQAFDLLYEGEDTLPTDAQWWELLTHPDMVQLAVEPVYARACSDHRCVGVRVSDATCVCPPPVE